MLLKRCVTYGFEVALGKKIGTAEFAVGARLSMVGTWHPTFVSHKRFAISNVTLAATARLFPGGFQELGGTLNGRFALCHRDLVTCVNGFSDSQVCVFLVGSLVCFVLIEFSTHSHTGGCGIVLGQSSCQHERDQRDAGHFAERFDRLQGSVERAPCTH